MEAILIFLGQAVIGGAVGHYVSEGLKRIHPELAELFTHQADPKAIEQFVLENRLEKKVEEFAVNTARSAYVIPNIAEGKANLRTRATLFADILTLGFTVSNARQLDLLLPGSFLGPHAFTLFTWNDGRVPSITITGTIVNVQQIGIYNNLIVFPVGEDSAQGLWEGYQAELLTFWAETHGRYFHAEEAVSAIKGFAKHCEVTQVAAGALTYEHASLMTSEVKGALGMTDKKAPVRAPYKGIHKMLDGVATVLAIDILDQDEEASIDAIYDRLKTFRGETKGSGNV